MSSPPIVDIRTSFGAAFIGLIVCTTLFGLTLAQTWIYFWHYRKRDPKTLKFFVVFVTTMDALNTIACSYAIYWYLVINFGNIESLDYIVWPMKIQVAIGAFVGASVQLFYARRVYILSQSIICPIFIVTLVAIAFSFGFFFTAKEFAVGRFSELHPLVWDPCVGMTAIAAADLLIATAMCWSLYRKKTGFSKTDSLIMTLMAYSINSGLLTSLLGIAAIITFVASPSMIWLAFLWVMGKCSINSLLAMLNSRDYLRERSDPSNTENAFTGNLSSIRISPPSEAYGSKSRQTGVSVAVHHSTAPDFSQNKSDHDVGLTFEVPKPGASIILPQSQSRTSESSA